MGRAFEYRKARKLKRWGNMSRTFTRIGKEITIAAKAGGPDPSTNPRLRALMQNAKAANMPKDTVERAIKKATDKDAGDFKEITYEGYGPFGIAIFVEAATDNNTRTVANVRSYFNKHGGSLGTQGSLTFLFEHKSVFKIKPKDGVSLDDLELELIDSATMRTKTATNRLSFTAHLKNMQTFRNISKRTASKSLVLNSNVFPTTSRMSLPNSASLSTNCSKKSRRTKMFRTFSTTCARKTRTRNKPRTSKFS